MSQQDLFASSPERARIVRVVPETSFERCLDYALPAAWADRVQAGHRLRVPWGRKEVFAYAVEFPDQPEVESCRQALELIGDEPLIPPSLIRLARWMADYYCCGFTQALKCMVPELLRQREDAFKEQLWVEVVNPPSDATPRKSPPPSARAQHRALSALQALAAQGGGWLAVLCRDTGTTPATWRALERRGLVRVIPRNRERDPFRAAPMSEAPAFTLTDEQQAAVDLIETERHAESPRPVLLHGVTGSGKTEVYLRLLSRVLAEGRQALVLVPEISLTPQTVERFRARFESVDSDQTGVAVLHSHLSAGERHDQWQRIRDGRASIVIGARSAIFAPLTRLGIVIVDEEHEHSFKQEDTPRYQARDLAVLRGSWEKAVVVLGSATPSLESFHHARSGKYALARLTHRTDGRRLPMIHVVDLRREKKSGPEGHLISTPLRDAMRSRLDRGEQMILFLNRRGFSTSLQCPNCGETIECPSCSVPMTYHRHDGEIRCHLCGHVDDVPDACPACQFKPLKFAGTGTQKVEDAVARLFPTA